jgi:hypothetical protein
MCSAQDELPKVREMMAVGSKYNNAAVEIVHPRLRAMMGLQPGVTVSGGHYFAVHFDGVANAAAVLNLSFITAEHASPKKAGS